MKNPTSRETAVWRAHHAAVRKGFRRSAEACGAPLTGLAMRCLLGTTDPRPEGVAPTMARIGKRKAGS
jgi:hypothetical protein